MTTARVPSTAVRAASTAVFVSFLLNGFNFASWASRLPAVRDELGMEPEQLGLLLLVASIGSICALPLSGLVVQRLGARRAIITFATVNVAGLLFAALGVALTSLWLVVPALVLFGVGTGVWDSAMNLEGAAVEQALGRAIMPRFHAGFSFGTMAGAGVGAIAAALHASVLAHLSIGLVLSLVGVVVSARWFLPEGTHDAHSDDTDAASSPHAPRRSRLGAWGEPRTLLIGLVVLAAALTEGAANDWVSLAVVDGFGTDHATGAIGFGIFVTAMTAMRLLGTGLLDRWGRIAVLRLSAGLSIVGLLVFGLVPSLVVALVGVVLWGMGAALGFPVGMSAASDDPRRAAPRVAVVATIGYSAFFVGPPLLGMLAQHVGYRQALLAIAVPVVVGLLVLPAARPLPTAAGLAPRDGAAPAGDAGPQDVPRDPRDGTTADPATSVPGRGGPSLEP
ncbi:MFS transporter [Actinotalea solisilvae]|uniref:MFS transporter n=1 Tax=Actinotalea solisilvae TaxID=2072922 RepID=UPI0018F16691|nr:MFS transporter [Actinotalea solisilvae]